MKQFFLIIILISLIFHKSYSQGTDISLSKTHFYFGINLIPAQSEIVNKDIFNSTNLISEPNKSINASIECGFIFSKIFGIGFGLGYSSYSSKFILNSYENTYNTIDSENDNYEMRINGSNIVENQKISSINVPLLLMFQIPFSDKFGLFINSGVNLSYPIVKDFTYTGTFSYSGYYPQYNVTLYDIPEHGFPSNVRVINNGDLGIKSLNVNLILASGFYFRTSSKTTFSIGCYYDNGISNISDYDNSNFQLTRFSGDYNSLMSSASKVTTHAFGLQVAFKYFVK